MSSISTTAKQGNVLVLLDLYTSGDYWMYIELTINKLKFLRIRHPSLANRPDACEQNYALTLCRLLPRLHDKLRVQLASRLLPVDRLSLHM